MLGQFDLLWVVLGQIVVLTRFGLFWVSLDLIFGRLGLFWLVLGRFGSVWFFG